MVDSDVNTVADTTDDMEEISKEQEHSWQVRSFIRTWARRATKIDFQVVDKSRGQVLDMKKHLVQCAKCEKTGLMVAWNVLTPPSSSASSSSLSSFLGTEARVPGSELTWCEHCGQSAYCSEACRVKDVYHKYVCVKPSPSEIRSMLETKLGVKKSKRCQGKFVPVKKLKR